MSDNHKYTIGLEVTDIITGRHGVITNRGRTINMEKIYNVTLNGDEYYHGPTLTILSEDVIRLRNTGVVERMIPVDNAPDMIRGEG